MTDAEVLRELRRTWPDPLTAAQLAERLEVTVPAASTRLVALRRAGLVCSSTGSGTSLRWMLALEEAAAVERRRTLTVHEGGRP
jgi:DNA-binding transcriptional ArsR family regulator